MEIKTKFNIGDMEELITIKFDKDYFCKREILGSTPRY